MVAGKGTGEHADVDHEDRMLWPGNFVPMAVILPVCHLPSTMSVILLLEATMRPALSCAKSRETLNTTTYPPEKETGLEGED